jgi:hypothetical protein
MLQQLRSGCMISNLGQNKRVLLMARGDKIAVLVSGYHAPSPALP